MEIVNTSSNPLPTYATVQSAGMDLRADLTQPVQIRPGKTILISTGLKIKLPPGKEAQIRSRSGMSLKRGLIVLNAPGTIDPDYRGEIKVILHNVGANTQVIEHGDRIAQMVISSFDQPKLIEVESLDETERGQGGFGSTGY